MSRRPAERAVVERVEPRRGVLAQRLGVAICAQPDRAVALERDRDGGEARQPTASRCASARRAQVRTALRSRCRRPRRRPARSRGRRRRTSPSSPISSSAPSSRACAAAWRPSRFSHVAHPATSRARTGASSGPTSASPSSERFQRLLEPPGGGQRLRQPDEQLEPAAEVLRRAREEPQRGGEAARRPWRALAPRRAGRPRSAPRAPRRRPAARSAPGGGARAASEPPRSASAAAARPCAAIRQPSAAES